MTRYAPATAILTLLLLASCGGSGGMTVSPPPPPSPPPPANSAPVISSSSTARVQENSSGTAYTVTATDADNDTVMFSVTANLAVQTRPQQM